MTKRLLNYSYLPTISRLKTSPFGLEILVFSLVAKLKNLKGVNKMDKTTEVTTFSLLSHGSFSAEPF